MRESFIEWRPQGKSYRLLHIANRIAEDLAARGYSLTLRQLYYQLVSQDVIPNNQLSYDRLGELINNGRLAGVMDWDLVEDRTRRLRGIGHEESVVTALHTAARNFSLDHWIGQDRRVEVWVEKDALVDVIGGAAMKYDVDFFSCRGYTSSTAMYRAAKRHRRYEADGHAPTLLLHLGDHDPSGMDMTRDITERLAMFGAETEVRRIALNMDQVEKYNPPANPAKVSDKRSDAYIAEFGPSSWELDALDPEVLETLITEAIAETIDDPIAFDRRSEEQVEGRKWLVEVASNETAVNALRDAEWELPDVEELEATVENLRADNATLGGRLSEAATREGALEVKAEGLATELAGAKAELITATEDLLAARRTATMAVEHGGNGELVAALREAMSSVGDTTRAVALKKKIEELLP